MGGVGVNMLDTYQDAGANILILIEQISLFRCYKNILLCYRILTFKYKSTDDLNFFVKPLKVLST